MDFRFPTRWHEQVPQVLWATSGDGWFVGGGGQRVGRLRWQAAEYPPIIRADCRPIRDWDASGARSDDRYGCATGSIPMSVVRANARAPGRTLSQPPVSGLHDFQTAGQRRARRLPR